jgi:long-chain acyl-CoA synthetase
MNYYEQFRPRPVQAILEDTVSRAPGLDCLDFLGRVYTYGDIGDLVDRAARGFQDLNISKGERIGLCLPNTPYYVIAYFAALKAGATVVNFNPLYTAGEIAGQIAASGVRFMVTIDEKSIYPKVVAAFAGIAEAVIVVCPLKGVLPTVKGWMYGLFRRARAAPAAGEIRNVSYSELIANAAAAPVHIEPFEDIAVLQYTGGTTGKPKGVMLTHANVAANTEQVRLLLGATVDGEERILSVLPFFHAFAMTGAMNLGIATASKLILLPRFDLALTIKTIETKRPTLFPVVPTIINAINHYPGRRDLSSLRYCISGGAPLPVEAKARFEKLTGCVALEGYGLSEASPVVTCNPPEGENKPGSVGLPLPWTDVEFRDPDDPGQRVGEGERGEITVRGPQVMKGYWNDAKATGAVLKDGWLRTGDIGRRDSSGYIFLTDRLKDVIFCSGFKVYPRIIEDALYRHPDVAEVVVAGVADDYRGEAPKAFIKLRDGAKTSEDDILAFAASNLNPIERPTAVEFRGELPKTFIGKLSRKGLFAGEEAKEEEPGNG